MQLLNLYTQTINQAGESLLSSCALWAAWFVYTTATSILVDAHTSAASPEQL